MRIHHKLTKSEYFDRVQIFGELSVFKEFGFIPYYDYFIHKDWIKDKLPYERMAIPKEQVIKEIVF